MPDQVGHDGERSCMVGGKYGQDEEGPGRIWDSRWGRLGQIYRKAPSHCCRSVNLPSISARFPQNMGEIYSWKGLGGRFLVNLFWKWDNGARGDYQILIGRPSVYWPGIIMQHVDNQTGSMSIISD